MKVNILAEGSRFCFIFLHINILWKTPDILLGTYPFFCFLIIHFSRFSFYPYVSWVRISSTKTLLTILGHTINLTYLLCWTNIPLKIFWIATCKITFYQKLNITFTWSIAKIKIRQYFPFPHVLYLPVFFYASVMFFLLDS